MAVAKCPEVDVFVPGRLCLFGEHSDWAGGYRKHNPDIRPGRTLVVGTEQGLHARAAPLDRAVLEVRSTRDDGTHEAASLALDADQLAQTAAAGGFWAYAAGVAYRLLTDFGVGGLSLDNHRTTLPLKKGLSSSAAFCVLVVRAFNRVYGLGLTTRGEMEYAYQGERLTPSQCGKMDQAVAFGQVPVLMVYDGEVVHVSPVALRAALHLVLVDLRAAKDTVAILQGLQEAYPHPQNGEQAAAVQLLGPINERITSQALAAMEAGDVARIGELMVEAQREFDARAAPLCPEALASPVLHRVLAHAPIQPLIFGGKGVGSQGDGTAQLLCRGAAAQAAVCALLEVNLGVHCLPLTVLPTSAAADGSGVSAAAAGAAAAGARGGEGGGEGGGDGRLSLRRLEEEVGVRRRRLEEAQTALAAAEQALVLRRAQLNEEGRDAAPPRAPQLLSAV